MHPGDQEFLKTNCLSFVTMLQFYFFDQSIFNGHFFVQFNKISL